MPCNCEHLEPTVREAHISQAAELLVWLINKMNWPRPGWLSHYAGLYPADDRPVVELCEKLTAMRETMPVTFDAVVYDAKDRMSRRLADWWEDHCKHDRERKEK